MYAYCKYIVLVNLKHIFYGTKKKQKNTHHLMKQTNTIFNIHLAQLIQQHIYG